jgi:Fe-S cluster assembly iron-binding protein IscA
VLQLTEHAQEVIKGIVDENEVGAGGGLRITSASGGNGDAELEFDLAEAAEDGDETVTAGGANVFLDPTAAQELADKTLDVHEHGDHFHFSLEEQAG